jgi:hypothetical protein
MKREVRMLRQLLLPCSSRATRPGELVTLLAQAPSLSNSEHTGGIYIHIIRPEFGDE